MQSIIMRHGISQLFYKSEKDEELITDLAVFLYASHDDLNAHSEGES